MTHSKLINAMTIDVEDYYHVSAFANSISRSNWDSLESRVVANTNRFLDIFDNASIKATFFVLGLVAEKYPALVKSIVSRGHELACHGYSHQLIYKQSPEQFRQETLKAKGLLEDVSGNAVHGYRAASYSITDKSRWALEILIAAGFQYDSSIVPVRHDLYGMSNAKVFPYRMKLPDGSSMIEFPPSTISIVGKRIPIGGGGYFRLFPFWFSAWGLNKINRDEQMPFSFYLHPWEIDPDQPRINAGWKSTFRHYNNLRKCEPRLLKLMKQFKFDTMRSVLDSLALESMEMAVDSHTDS